VIADLHGEAGHIRTVPIPLWVKEAIDRWTEASGIKDGGELDQIQFLLGHVSIQTTEQYLGCKQKLRVAVNDRIGIEP